MGRRRHPGGRLPTHGVVANTERNAAIDTALAAFVLDKDAAKFARAVAAGHN
ncbi:hypothetical protein [Dactylosporangium sp. NPDC049140]|uniref:hypothetical protein n=1 Tax=Dactylosporangium sp. NPDC049140 TaxID=3155647 RepID=UPI0033FEAE72